MYELGLIPEEAGRMVVPMQIDRDKRPREEAPVSSQAAVQDLCEQVVKIADALAHMCTINSTSNNTK
jgi:hypothetical protein